MKETLESRLYRRSVRIGDCTVWRGAKDTGGYGRIHLTNPRRLEGTHRVSYLLFVGQIPPGMFVLHKCDNPPCINPAHLYLGDQADNQRDASDRGRSRGSHSIGSTMRYESATA